MPENALDRKGELGRSSTCPNQKLTSHCERVSGILHPCLMRVGQNVLHPRPANGNNTSTVQFVYFNPSKYSPFTNKQGFKLQSQSLKG